MVGLGSLASGGRFCVCASGRNLASDAVKMFSHLIYFINNCYRPNCCTFNAICKDNATINCITLQQKKGSFPLNLTGYYASVQ
jgi:hypothetical protein